MDEMRMMNKECNNGARWSGQHNTSHYTCSTYSTRLLSLLLTIALHLGESNLIKQLVFHCANALRCSKTAHGLSTLSHTHALLPFISNIHSNQQPAAACTHRATPALPGRPLASATVSHSSFPQRTVHRHLKFNPVAPPNPSVQPTSASAIAAVFQPQSHSCAPLFLSARMLSKAVRSTSRLAAKRTASASTSQRSFASGKDIAFGVSSQRSTPH